MRITRRKLKMIIESFLLEKEKPKKGDCPEGQGKPQPTGPYVCPRCGQSHDHKPDD